MHEVQMVVFELAGERYGVPVEQVQSIEWPPPVTRVPRTLPFIVGVTSLRGTVIPVLDLRERFGFPQAATDERRMMVVDVDGMTVGLLVDTVVDVQSVNVDRIEPPPTLAGGVEAAYLRGIVQTPEGVLVLLNLNRVLSDAEAKQLKEAERYVRGE